MIIQDLATLKIHRLTQEQYDKALAEGVLDETALYLTPEEEVTVDDTLTIPGAFADAKAVGDALGECVLKSDRSVTIQDNILILT